MPEYTVSDPDPERLDAFEQAFHALYADKGPEAPLNEAAIRQVVRLAVHALGDAGREFLSDISSGVGPEDSSEAARLTYSDEACERVRSAAVLLSRCRNPDFVSPSDIDDAYAALAGADIGHSPTP